MKHLVGKYQIHFTTDRYIKQVLQDKEYGFLDYYPTIIDIGANIGMFSLSMYDKADKIFAIEPSEENINHLKTTIEANGLNKIFPIQAAISDTSMVKMLYRHGEAGGGGWKLDEQGDLPVQTFSLVDFMDIHKIDYADLVKIDVEGHEDIIFGGSFFPKDRVGTIIGEWHNENLNHITKLLEWMGYRFIDVGNNHFLARKK